MVNVMQFAGSALIVASTRGHASVVDMLLNHGADVAFMNKVSSTPDHERNLIS